MHYFTHNWLISVAFALACVSVAWATPVRAADPDLIDVIEITDPNPFITHTNILPGDVFMDTMTVRNLTGTAQNIVMSLDIDLSQGIVSHPPFELEERLMTHIERVGSGDITLPGGGTLKPLQDLDDTLIDLGTIPGNSQQEYRIHTTFDRDAGNEYQNTKVYFNIAMSLEIPDIQGSLRILKTNDSVGPEAPGSEVEYTLTVTALNGDVDDVVLTDLPPEGFDYVPGSGQGAPFIHEYASPGVWNLGDMNEGETKTLTYRTKISSAQDDGLYRDLAYARGVSGSGAAVLADDVANGHPSVDSLNPVGDNFVGTRVTVATDATPRVVIPEDNENKLIEKTKKKIQYVLGASLPMTGANGKWIVFAAGLFLVGGGLMFWGRRLRKQNGGIEKASFMKAILGLLVAGVLFGSGQVASAATLSVKLETPDAIVSDPNFKIGFVALDMLGRSVSVECYTVSAGLFETHALATGGGSGDCQMNATVLPVDGSYEMYVKAIATDTVSETVESNHVSVVLDSVFPGTPLNYDRNDGSCQNVITFTTANDGGKTVKVELYRSAATTFTADSSTKVAELAIGSNLAGNFTLPAPGCSNDVYYALRAVAAGGNGSGFVGDKDVNVDTHTITKNKNTTVTLPGGGQTAGAIATGGGTTASTGQVEGVTTDAEDANASQASGTEGSVLGEATEGGAATLATGLNAWVMAHPWLAGIIFLLILALGRYSYSIYREKKQHDGSLE